MWEQTRPVEMRKDKEARLWPSVAGAPRATGMDEGIKYRGRDGENAQSREAGPVWWSRRSPEAGEFVWGRARCYSGVCRLRTAEDPKPSGKTRTEGAGWTETPKQGG